MVVHACNGSMWKIKTGRPQPTGQPEPQCEYQANHGYTE